MPAAVLYFQIHQPFRLRPYSAFDTRGDYFDDARNAEILRRIAGNCYRPALRILLEQFEQLRGDFRFALSITGAALDQLGVHAPDVLDLLRTLADTGACEFLAETYHHSLASIHSPREFVEQIDLHTDRIRALFGRTPSTFRNTELIYSNDIAGLIASLDDARGRPRFRAILAEGVDSLLRGRSPGHPFRPAIANSRGLKVLLRDYPLSDDIAFRFTAAPAPLTAPEFAARVARAPGPLCNLFMDFETFGEHHPASSGILDFLAALPAAILSAGSTFLTPAEAAALPAPDTYDAPEPTSWADTERDLSAWCGSAMQADAVREYAALEPLLRAAPEGERLITTWRRLGSSDHFYYMAGKAGPDGRVHRHFSPYESPYDAYINLMNVLDDLRRRLAPVHPGTPALPTRPGSGTIAASGDLDRA